MEAGKHTVKFLNETYPLFYVKECAVARGWINRLLEQPDAIWGIDTETATLPKYKDRPRAALNPWLSKTRLLQIFTGRTAFVFDIGYIPPKYFTKLLESRRWVGHNSCYDLQYFYGWFRISQMNIGCTMLAAKLCFHALSHTDAGLSASLRNLVNIIFKQEILKEEQSSDWSEPDLNFSQVEYAALDAICTLKLAEKLAVKLQNLDLVKIYQLYKEAQHPIVAMQLNGMKIDSEKHAQMFAKWAEDAKAAEKEVKELTGLTKLTSSTMAEYLEEHLDPQSLAIWPRTDTGKLQTDANAFVDFGHLPVVAPFSKFQKSSKLVSSFGVGLQNAINPETKRVHSQYNMAGARTGRLSCSQPNAQQYPRDRDFRALFIAAPGFSLVVADYSSIEVRVIAEYSRDSEMLASYKAGRDIYTDTAAKLNGVPYESIDKKSPLRQGAKALVLGLMYGLGAAKFSFYANKTYGVKISTEEAQNQVADYRVLYSGLRNWQNRQVKEVAANGCIVTTMTGKKRKLDPDNAYGASLNTPIQGSAAEIMLAAMVFVWKAIKDTPDIKLIASVHDELILEVKKGLEEKAKSILENCMVMGYKAVFPQGQAIKNLVDAHSGANWAEAKA